MFLSSHWKRNFVLSGEAHFIFKNEEVLMLYVMCMAFCGAPIGFVSKYIYVPANSLSWYFSVFIKSIARIGCVNTQEYLHYFCTSSHLQGFTEEEMMAPFWYPWHRRLQRYPQAQKLVQNGNIVRYKTNKKNKKNRWRCCLQRLDGKVLTHTKKGSSLSLKARRFLAQ